MRKFRQYPKGGKNGCWFLGEIYKESRKNANKQPFFMCNFEKTGAFSCMTGIPRRHFYRFSFIFCENKRRLFCGEGADPARIQRSVEGQRADTDALEGHDPVA